jgi:RNA recognition motif-containing protein
MSPHEQTNERTVYLGDLDMNMSEKQLQEFFYSHNIATVKVAKQPYSSYAHVTFVSHEITRKFLDASSINLHARLVRVMPFNQSNTFDPNANLIIKNLESYLTEADIINKLSLFGDILSCKLVRDDKGDSKCYSYLQFKDKQAAAEAIDKLNNTYWDEKCDPDYKYKMFQEKLSYLKHSPLSISSSSSFSSLGKLNESNLQESELFADFNNKMGKKIYVGLFKKKDEYSKIKSDKEGKPSNLYVKNFGTSFGDRDLFNLFKAYGSIKSAKVRRLKTGLVEKPLGCGFVDFENPEEAEAARLALDNFALPECAGRVISVTYADCKSRRMRKKLEETSSAEILKPQSQPSRPKFFFESQLQSQSLIMSQQQQQQQRMRQASVSSESSNDSLPVVSSLATSSLASTSMVLREFDDEDLWNKILGTNQWSQYKLFG